MGAVDLSEDLWRISQDNLSMTEVASAVPMALAHSVELNAGNTGRPDWPPAAGQLDVGAFGVES